MNNDNIFNAVDNIMYFFSEFLLGLILFTPIISIIWGVNFDKNSGLTPAEIHEFVSYIINPSFFLSIAGLAFLYSIMAMVANTTFIFTAGIVAFLTVMYIGFGIAGPLVAAVPVILFFIAKRSARLTNFLIDFSNHIVDNWKKSSLQKQLKAENITGMEDQDSFDSPAAKIMEGFVKTAFLCASILLVLSLITKLV